MSPSLLAFVLKVQLVTAGALRGNPAAHCP